MEPKVWEELYKEKGIVQKEPSNFVKDAVEFFKQRNVNNVLDMGCGTGRHITYLLDNGFKASGCDSSETALDIAKDVIDKIEFKLCSKGSLPYEDSSFDAILCHFVVQHGKTSIVKSSIEEMHRVLKKDGILFLSVPSTKHPEFLTGEEIEPGTKINIDAIDGKEPHHYFTEEELKEMLAKFKILKMEHVEFPSERNPDKNAAAWIVYAQKVNE